MSNKDMSASISPKPRRVLIASSHPLFGQGLRSLLSERRHAGVEVVGMVTNLEEALAALEVLTPDLIIVDYDDQAMNREEFLARFVEGEKKLRVVLLSLQSPSEAIVYDRRSMAASQIDNWLEEWRYSDEVPEKTGQDIDSKQKRENRSTGMKHLVIAAILVVVVTAGLIFGMQYVRLLPEAASSQATPIDNLFRLEFMVIAFLFSLIVVFMVYSIIVFRRKRGDTTDAVHIEGNTRLEVVWTLIPLATVLAFAYLGSQSLADTLRPDPKPLVIDVIGQQWSWRFEYPDLGIVSTELVMPEKKQAVLRLISVDVIHSFWVPEFRVKQDALPGGPEFVRELRVTPTTIGNYTLRCAELCGQQHTYMLSQVRVLSDADYQAWVAQESGISDDPVVRGQKLSEQYGCIACHSIDGSIIVGPSWLGLYQSERIMEDGSTVIADEDYLREAIINSNARIVQGYPANVMPANFGEVLTDEQISDLIEYIKTIK